MLRALATTRSTEPAPFDVAVLTHAERHIRRRVLALPSGGKLLVDLPRATLLRHGERLLLEDGRHVEILAAIEDLMQVRAGPRTPLATLAWHLGNRHVPAMIEANRILVENDLVIRDMLRGLGAFVENVRAPFEPLRGAYHRHEGPDEAPLHAEA
jgi:urease accessory protein